MANGYFCLEGVSGGYGIRIFPPTDSGKRVELTEVMDYLSGAQIPFREAGLLQAISAEAGGFCSLGMGECPRVNERYSIKISDDIMEATARFYPASSTGSRLTYDEVFRDLRGAGIVAGIQVAVLQEHFQSEGIYCTDLVVAKGKEPRHGKDARIEYNFNLDVNTKPAMKEDGSVDYFDLNMLSPCHKGEVLARIIPEDPGEEGINVKGGRISPRKVNRAVLRFGRNITLSEDKLSITSDVDGHVTLVDDTVFVSDVYEVENVDTSTGNIEFAGSVQVNGNVAANFTVKAKGNVMVKGVVEGAHIEAGGNIIIARGMNGMFKGTLKAKGNIVAKFLENVTAEAEGYIEAEAIMHSKIYAGTDVEVTGTLIGGRVRAAQKIEVKTLGADMGATTVVEVGVDPQLKLEYARVQKEVLQLVQEIQQIQKMVADFNKKRASGARITEDLKKSVQNNVALVEGKKNAIEAGHARLVNLQKALNPGDRAVIIVKGEVYPHTKIVIDDVSMLTQSLCHFCRFEKEAGNVMMKGL